MTDGRVSCPCGCGALFIPMVAQRELGVRTDAAAVRGLNRLRAADHTRSVVLLTGLPGAGKSTVARQLAERFDRAAHIDIDMVFHHFTVSGLVHPNDRDRAEAERQSLLAVRNAASLASNYFDAGFLPVLDGAIVVWDHVRALADVLAPRPLSLVVLAPSVEECGRRDAARSGKQVADAYAYMAPLMHRELAGHGLWLNTDGWSPEQTADTVLAHVLASPGLRPAEHIEACLHSHRRLLNAIAGVTDEQAKEPSLLPGWTRGHVITHVARKADSHVWLFEGAEAGEVRHQYPRPGMRDADIESGAARRAAVLRADVTRAFERIEQAFASLPDDLWASLGIVQPGPRTMAEIVFRHLRDVEVHHVDLGIGYQPSDWPALYVEGELARRLPPLPGRADHAALLAWLLGRADAPALGPW